MRLASPLVLIQHKDDSIKDVGIRGEAIEFSTPMVQYVAGWSRL